MEPGGDSWLVCRWHRQINDNGRELLAQGNLYVPAYERSEQAPETPATFEDRWHHLAVAEFHKPPTARRCFDDLSSDDFGSGFHSV